MDISDLVPFLFFAIVGVGALIKKLAEQASQDKAKRDSEKGGWTSVEDLPEETRRMLFGDGKPRQAPPPLRQAQPRQAQPREAIPVRRAQPVAPAPVARPVPTARPTAPRRPAPQRPTVRQQQEMFRPVEQQRRRAVQEQPRRPQQQQRRQPAPPQRRPVPVQPQQGRPRRVAQRREAVQEQPRRQERPARPAPEQRARRRVRPAPARGLFGGLDEIRRGIIMAEVLGPPKALR